MTHPPQFFNWRNPSRSEPAESCVEISFTADHAAVGVRDSKDPSGPFLAVTAHDWETFVRGLPEPYTDK